MAFTIHTFSTKNDFVSDHIESNKDKVALNY